MKSWSSKGMTLLSMILVLFIVALLFTATLVYSEEQKVETELETCVYQILENYQSYQKKAVLNGRDYQMVLGRTSAYFIPMDYRGELPEEALISYPDSVRCDGYYQLDIRGYGGWTSGDTVTFSASSGEKIVISFQLGSGQYVVKKEQ